MASMDKLKYIIIFPLIFLVSAQLAVAQKKTVKDIFMLDRVALALTGMPASMQDKKDFSAGRKRLDDLLEQYKKHPRFEMKVAEFWNEVLKIDKPIDIMGSYSQRKTTGTPGGNFRYFRAILAGGSQSFTSLHAQYHPSCKSPGNSYSPLFVMNILKPPLEDRFTVNGKEYLNSLYNCGCRGNIGVVGNDCPNCNTVEVSPYWAPNKKVKVCRLMIEDEYCGKNLEKCFLGNDEGVTLYMPEVNIYDNIAYGMTMEAGMLIAKVVSNDRPWTDILTTADGVVNGPTAFMLNHSRVGPEFIESFMPNSTGRAASVYPERNTSPIFTKADASAVNKFDLVKVNDLEAGVLKTAAFHKITNGLRAKANRARESFLCKSYIPPEEPQTTSDEVDLTKKPYCSHCHKTLDPLSDFFKNWPANDNFNYIDAAVATGSYEGETEDGVEGLAKLFTKLPEFNECAVKRAFEFVVRRQMSEKEANNILNPLISTYLNNDKKIWPVIKQIIESPEFIGSGQN